MNYNLNIGKSLDNINFNYSVNKVIQLLGKPKEMADNGITLHLNYLDLGLLFSYEKENTKWTDMDIQTDKIIYNNTDWYSMEKKELIDTIKKIYSEKKFTYNFHKSEVEILNEQQYNFYEIGVTLFFYYNKLTNVTVSKPLFD